MNERTTSSRTLAAAQPDFTPALLSCALFALGFWYYYVCFGG